VAAKAPAASQPQILRFNAMKRGSFVMAILVMQAIWVNDDLADPEGPRGTES
jgi:hypothetical protein